MNWIILIIFREYIPQKVQFKNQWSWQVHINNEHDVKIHTNTHKFFEYSILMDLLVRYVFVRKISVNHIYEHFSKMINLILSSLLKNKINLIKICNCPKLELWVLKKSFQKIFIFCYTSAKQLKYYNKCLNIEKTVRSLIKISLKILKFF